MSLKQDQKWQAGSDARIMATYQEIINDKGRMNRAIKEANRQAKDLSMRANALRNAANTKSTGKSTTKKK